MAILTYLLQYHQKDKNSWSEWMECTFILNENSPVQSSVDASVFRVQDGHLVFWLCIQEGRLFKISPNSRNEINCALDLSTQEKINIRHLHQAEMFNRAEFANMQAEADEYRRPPFIRLEEIQSLLQRPSDTAYHEQLAAWDLEQLARHWNTQLLEKYRKFVEVALTKLLLLHPQYHQQISALKIFLKNHYELIQGTLLDYVAQPQHVANQALIHIAEKLANTCQIAAIDLLMPGIAQENLIDSFEFHDRTIAIRALKDIPLAELIQTHLFFEPNFLAPISYLLHYLKSPLTSHYLPYAQYQDDEILTHQMSSQDIEAFFAHSPITQAIQECQETLDNIAHSHNNLLGQLNLLVKKLKENDAHGGAGSHLDAGAAAYPAILNFSRYYHQLEACYFLTKDTPPEISDIPEDMHLAYVLYQDNLFFLNRFNNSMILVSTAMHPLRFDIHFCNMDRIEEIKAKNLTPAILKTPDAKYFILYAPDSALTPINLSDLPSLQILFRTQAISCISANHLPVLIYQKINQLGFPTPRFCQHVKEKLKLEKTLTDEELAWIETQTDHSYLSGYTHIPEDLRHEIETLLNFTKHHSKNVENHAATCIGTRGRALSQLINHDLAKIGIHETSQKQLILDAQNNLEQQIQLLCAPNYTGRNTHLGIHFKLINALDISLPPMHDYADLEILKLLRPQDLAIFLSIDQRLKNNIISLLQVPHQFKMYLVETPLATLEVILSNEFLYNDLVGTDNLLSLCDYLGDENEKINLLLQSMNIHMLVKKSFYIHIFPRLNPDQQDIICQKILHLFKTDENFTNFFLEDILDELSPTQSKPFVQIICEHFLDIIKNSFQFENFFFTLPIQLINQLYLNHQDVILEFIESDKQCYQILKYLPPVFHTEVLNYWLARRVLVQIQEHDLPFIIQTLGLLNGDNQEKYFQVVHPNILSIGLDHEACLRLLSHLTAQQKEIIFPDISELILGHIDDVESFLNYQALLPEHLIQFLLCETMDVIIEAIESIDDFCHLMASEHLNPKQKHTLFISHLKGILKLLNHENFNTIEKVLNQLSLEQKEILVCALDDLTHLSSKTFIRLMPYFSKARLMELEEHIFETLKNCCEHFNHAVILMEFNEEKFTWLMNFLYQHLDSLDSHFYYRFLPLLVQSELLPNQKAQLQEFTLRRFEQLTLVNNVTSHRLIPLFKLYPELCVIFREHLPFIIENYRNDIIRDDYLPLVAFFDAMGDEKNRVFQIMHGLWPQVLETSMDIYCILSRMDDEQTYALCMELEHNWARLIPDLASFYHIIDMLNEPPRHPNIHEIIQRILMNISEDLLIQILTEPEMQILSHMGESFKQQTPDLQRILAPYMLCYFKNFREASDYILSKLAHTELGALCQVMQELVSISSEELTWNFFTALAHSKPMSILSCYLELQSLQQPSVSQRFFNSAPSLEAIFNQLPSYWKMVLDQAINESLSSNLGHS